MQNCMTDAIQRVRILAHSPERIGMGISDSRANFSNVVKPIFDQVKMDYHGDEHTNAATFDIVLSDDQRLSKMTLLFKRFVQSFSLARVETNY